ncbi:MAG: menaquinone-dependent protoporphyrinogen dehydrogenase [Bacteroidota bacterium]
MRFLIVYSTTEGHTRKIARFMEEVLQEAGHQVAIADASEEPPLPENYDAILIGGSLHAHQYQSAIAHYIREHIARLNKMPGAFFSVCLAVASDLPEEHAEAHKIADDFLHITNWKPLLITQIAGALRYSQYDFLRRIIMKMISKKEGRETDTNKDYEYTDWNAVKQFALDFAAKAIQEK